MKFDTPATTNPIDQLRVVGKPTDRIDGPVTARELADELAVDPGARAAVVVLGAAPGVRLRVDEVHGPGGLPRRIGVAERSGDLVLVVPAATDVEVHDAAESALRTLGRVVEEHVVAGVGA